MFVLKRAELVHAKCLHARVNNSPHSTDTSMVNELNRQVQCYVGEHAAMEGHGTGHHGEESCTP